MLSFENKSYIKSSVRFFIGATSEGFLILLDVDNRSLFSIVADPVLVKSIVHSHQYCKQCFSYGFEFIKVPKYDPDDFISENNDMKWSEIVEYIVADVVSIVEEHIGHWDN